MKRLVLLVLVGSLGCSHFNPSARAHKRAVKAGNGQEYDDCIRSCDGRLSVCEAGDNCKTQYKGCIRVCRGRWS